MVRERLTVDPCAGEIVAVVMGHGDAHGHVWGAHGFGPERGKAEREGAGGQRHRASEHAHWCAWAVVARASWGERRDKEEGTEAWCVADVEAHRRARWGGPRWPEAVGRGRLQCGSAL